MFGGEHDLAAWFVQLEDVGSKVCPGSKVCSVWFQEVCWLWRDVLLWG